jgi:hypothetical protein
MYLQRSKTAPQTLTALVTAELQRSASQSQITLKSSRVSHLNYVSSPITPRTDDREDPFSLQGFYPSYGHTEESDWAWLKDETEIARTGLLPNATVDVDQINDQIAGKLIEEEDKMGILSLGKGTIILPFASY